MDVYDLALLGGKPIRRTKLGYGHQYIDEADIQAVVDTLKSDYLTCGPKVEELEQRLGGALHRRFQRHRRPPCGLPGGGDRAW